MSQFPSPPPLSAEVTVTAGDRPAALDALLRAGRSALARAFGPGAQALVDGVPPYLLQVSRVLRDAAGPDGHTLRAVLTLPYGVLERASLRDRPELTGRAVQLGAAAVQDGAGVLACEALGRALTDVGFTVDAAPGVGGHDTQVSVWAQVRPATGAATSAATAAATARVKVTLNGRPAVSRSATGCGPTPQVAARSAVTHAALSCAHPLVLALLECP
ncbi:hypothetical protein [Deinococcus sp. JMULE3]|uniref:hypothetical protein n=1 Tax=Deinococcus sp. JMULE3 TaxID=2518341 RepID=UPI0015753B7D|nr:hypothetical protein [Deinococcus sp. JMULE3]NTY02618.1 hypothetical protein [Deinococcus sp. JMULE3]